MATTKRELARRISARTGVTQETAREVVQAFLDEMLSELGEGHRLEFRDFGIFDVQEKRARLARNPRTGERVRVPAKRVVQFKPGRLMKQQLERPRAKATAESPSPATGQ